MEEIWKDIEGYEGLYQVSNMGRVRSLGKGESNASICKILKQFKTGMYRNYYSVKLCKNGKEKTFKVHRLVAETFIPNPNKLPQINHKDENTENNQFDNLEWCDAKYNSNYGTRTNRQKEKMINGKLSKPIMQFTIDGVFIKIWPSISEVSRVFNYSSGSLCQHLKGLQKTAIGYIWKYAD